MSADIVERLIFDHQEDLDKMRVQIEEKGYPIKIGPMTITGEIQSLVLRGNDTGDEKVTRVEKKKITKQKKTKKDSNVTIRGMKIDGNTVTTESINVSGNGVGFDFSKM